MDGIDVVVGHGKPKGRHWRLLGTFGETVSLEGADNAESSPLHALMNEICVNRQFLDPRDRP
jgi:hypothetical protein